MYKCGRGFCFELYGCGDDPNILWIPDYPEPYLRIRHTCNWAGAEEVKQLSPFLYPHWHPNVIHVGEIELDSVPKVLSPAVRFIDGLRNEAGRDGK